MAAPNTDEVLEETEATASAEPEAVEAEVLEDETQDASEEKPQEEADTSSEKHSSTDEMVAKAQSEAKEWQDKYLRLHAEWDTYRRRMNEQREEERARATEKLVEGLIPAIDDFERSIAYAEQNGEKGLLDGIKAVHTKINEILAKEGVEIIDPKGEPFDALSAQAVATVDDDSVPDETVAEVYQKGYRMGNKVIRSAMVTVAVGGPKREEPEDEED